MPRVIKAAHWVIKRTYWWGVKQYTIRHKPYFERSAYSFFRSGGVNSKVARGNSETLLRKTEYVEHIAPFLL